MNGHQEHTDNVLHERTRILNDRGYRGFSVISINQEWQDTRVTVKNSSGKTISASGETKEEAYQNIIEKIDLFLD